MNQLSKKNMARQDFVDNQIFDLINSLLPPSKRIAWDIEVIASVREALRDEAVDSLQLTDEMNFYPFIKLGSSRSI